MEGVIEKGISKLQSAWVSVSQASSQKLAKLLNLLEKRLDKQIDKQSKSKPCTKNILCNCNKRSCPYKEVSVIYYWRKMKQI